MENGWQYTTEALNASPSRKDSIDKLTEQRYRREGMEFIKAMADSLNLYDSHAS